MLTQLNKYCKINISEAEVRMIYESSKTFDLDKINTKSERNMLGNKMLYSKSKKTENEGRLIMNSPAREHYMDFIHEIEAYYIVQEKTTRFNIKTTEIKLYKHDPAIISILLQHLLKNSNLNDDDPSGYHYYTSEIIFRKQVEKFASDIKEVEQAMKTHRIHELGWE